MFYEQNAIGGLHVGGFYVSHKPVHLHRTNMQVAIISILRVAKQSNQTLKNSNIFVRFESRIL